MDWQQAAKTLAAMLAANGELTDPAWRQAFEQVPHLVVQPARGDGGDAGTRPDRAGHTGAGDRNRDRVQRRPADTSARRDQRTLDRAGPAAERHGRAAAGRGGLPAAVARRGRRGWLAGCRPVRPNRRHLRRRPHPPAWIDQLADGGRTFGQATAGIGQYGTTGLDPARLDHTDQDLILLLHLHLPGLSIGGLSNSDGKFLTLTTPAGAAQVALVGDADGRFTTIQHGVRLWDTAEHVADLWERLGRPARGRYGISALNRADRQYVWLDDPNGRYAWQLPM